MGNQFDCTSAGSCLSASPALTRKNLARCTNINNVRNVPPKLTRGETVEHLLRVILSMTTSLGSCSTDFGRPAADPAPIKLGTGVCQHRRKVPRTAGKRNDHGRTQTDVDQVWPKVRRRSPRIPRTGVGKCRANCGRNASRNRRTLPTHAQRR